MIPFRIRIMAAVLIAALAPLAAVGALLVVTSQGDPTATSFASCWPRS